MFFLSKTKNIVYVSLLVSLGIVFHYFEGLVINLPMMPGAKIGLANVVTLITLMFFGFGPGLWVSVLRSVAGGVILGTFPGVGFFMGVVGAVTSCIVMAVFIRSNFKLFSLIGISILGAITHNISQLAVFYSVVQHSGVFFYAPYLILFGTGSGFLVGWLSIGVSNGVKRWGLTVGQ